jgi:arsenate reductase (glutaredoxin)
MVSFPIIVFHNPACGTSRNVVAMIRAAGYEPEIVDYLRTGWTLEQLQGLLSASGVRPRDILREKDTPAAELGLLDEGIGDEEILEAMVEHPILVNRPIVVSHHGTKLCRPSEVVFELLDRRPETFVKEDGEIVRP